MSQIAIAMIVGLALGALATYITARIYGGMMRNSLKLVMDSKAAEPANRAWAFLTCMAHASILDSFGHCEAAAVLTMVAHRYSRFQPLDHLIAPRARVDFLTNKYNAFIRQGNVAFMSVADPVIGCEHHGESLWAGHVQCQRCRRRYETTGLVDDQELGPEICECGHRLLCDPDGPTLQVSANQICKHCYEENKNDTHLDVPPPPDGERDVPIQVLPELFEWCKCANCMASFFVRFGGEERWKPDPFETCPACRYGAEEPEDE